MHPKSRTTFKRTALAVVLASLVGTAAAQSTTGSLYGSAPVAAGTTITVQNDSGLKRTVTVDANGRYNLGSLPVGKYAVTLTRDGQVIDKRENIQLKVGGGTEVSFASASAGDATNLDAITVTAANAPKIDVTNTVSKSVITSEQLEMLPLGRSAEAIALLAPGVVAGSSEFSNGSRSVLSFGGASVTENAYYINGFNTTNPLSGMGGVSLPYGSIDQQETFTGGYGARYGRSTGGVINQLGKRGTNEWHYGFQTTWSPDSLAASPRDVNYPNAALPDGYGYTNESLPGTLYRSRNNDTATRTTVSAYANGPLIEDRLFIHLAAETDKNEGVVTAASSSSQKIRNHATTTSPKFYGKIDWNINDDNILEYTRIENTDRYSGYYRAFDYATLTEGAPTGVYPNTTKLKDEYDIFKYTGYLTDDLTLSATYGRSKQANLAFNPAESSDPYLSGVANQNPAITGGTPIRNSSATYVGVADDAGSRTRGLRLDLEYRLGDHTLTGGVDNMYYSAHNEGQSMNGPGYAWIYSKAANPAKELSPSMGVGAPGGEGYYVRQYIFSTTTSMSVEQKAYFLQDEWQVSPNVLLSLGLRNDKFTNLNSAGVAYVESGDQWAPRLGATWDVFGDSSFKTFANLGRYYLALPNSVAIRGASASTYTNEYFTYTGIAADGSPTGLTAIGPGPVSTNNEYGQTPDPYSVAPTDLTSQYQDELILGFEKSIGSSWNSGAKVTYRRLQAAIDDSCDSDRIYDKLAALGIDEDAVTVPGCVIFNPGKTNTYMLANADGSGYTPVQMSGADWGYGKTEAKRSYVGIDLFIEHPMADGWYGRVDYTWSRSYGNTEGQVKSDLGQDDVSKTQDWDAAALMEYAGGYLANDRRHQLKAFGAYQLNDEWTASATLRIQSGMPKTCLGYYGDNEDPIGYGSSYHYCFGQPSAPGDAGRLPWTKRVDLGIQYRPAFAKGNLALSLDIFNVLNELKPVQTDSEAQSNVYTVSNTYNMGTYYTAPRSVRLSASYDF